MNEKFVDIMERSMNLIDSRLIDHGKLVAYRLFKALYPLKRYDDKKLCDIYILGLLHDIGAYKAEDISGILRFDTKNVWDHAIYGYLFLKYFSPVKDLAPVVLFHHANHSQMASLSEEHRTLAFLLKRSDWEDINLRLTKGFSYPDSSEMNEDEDFNRVFRQMQFTSKDAESFLRMIVFSIDFRSYQTMLHTFAATHVAETLARLSNLDESQIERLKTGAMMHDIGKMGIPLNILEGTARELSAPDMEIMRSHVVLSEEVLSNCVDDDIRNIAVNHHEKLNGKGYPKGLSASSLPYIDRLMAVADTFSAMCVSRSYQKALPKERVLEILNGMKNNNLLDKNIIDLTVSNYDEIAKSLDLKSRAVIADFESISKEQRWIHDEIVNGRFAIV